VFCLCKPIKEGLDPCVPFWLEPVNFIWLIKPNDAYNSSHLLAMSASQPYQEEVFLFLSSSQSTERSFDLSALFLAGFTPRDYSQRMPQ
jgi:hypothetical protein